MFFWFIGTAVLAVWYVFRDPRFDYRLLAVGAVLPELDALVPWDDGATTGVMHSLSFSAVLLALVMVVTSGRKPVRRLLLGLPIGTFLHLVFDGAWATTKVFWWPFGGWSFDGARLPSIQRGWWNIALETVGLFIVAGIWRRLKLGDPARRRDLLRTGRLFADPAPRQGSR